MNDKIFLIGFMGVGKSTIGKRLAKKLGYKFIDTDQLIESEQGKSINDIFKDSGESTFRDLETSALERITDNEIKSVVSVGGGLPCFNNNMEVMNQNGITIYLQRPAKELFHRLLQGKDKRPLLKGKTEDQLMDYIESMLNDRSIYYNQATITADREHQSIKSLIELIKSI
tara:strand:- start:113784 stop:114296 length:513 start_codon:yes stop_codon:yes gene_type:complete